MAKTKSSTPAIGDTVTFHFWAGGHEKGGPGRLHACPARVTGVWPAEKDLPQALALVVEGSKEFDAEGYAREQTHSTRRTPAQSEDDIHVSGTWSVPA